MNISPVALFISVSPTSPAERRDWVHGYRAYLRGGAAAWDRYDRLRAEGYSPSMALHHATASATALTVVVP